MTERSDRNGWQANLPPRWLNDSTYRGLSGNAWILHTWTLVWGVSQENDGNVTTRDLPFIAAPMLNRAESEEAASELVEIRIWEVTQGGYRVAGWESSQVTAAEISEKRSAWRAKNNRRKPSAPSESSSSTPGVKAGVSPSNGALQVGKGKNARTGTPGDEGQAMTRVPRFEQPEADPATGEVMDWPTAPIPETDGERWGSPDAPGAVVKRGAA